MGSAAHDIPCSHPAPKPLVAAFDDMMTIQMDDGSSMKKFLVYRGVLCFHSEFFKRILNGPFKEGGSSYYEVNDCAPETFTMFYNWMNTGVASVGQEDKHFGEEEKSWDIALDLYVFADFYAIPALKNYALEAYFWIFLKEWYLRWDSLNAIYERTAAKSSMRKLVVDLVIDTYHFLDLGDDMVEFGLPGEMIFDLLRASHTKGVAVGAASALDIGDDA